MPGIFVTKGMTVGFLSGTDLLSGNVPLYAHYDVCPVWLKISLERLYEARERRDERVIAWKTDDVGRKSASLEREFEASMQAVVSAAIAIDAFYSVVKDRAANNAMRGRSSRPAQVSEALKDAFRLKQKGFDILRDNVEKIYKLRDLAVHPKGSIGDTVEHPELGVGVEWRFACYSYERAFSVVRFTMGILHDLSCNGKPKTKQLSSYMEALKPQMIAFWSDAIFLDGTATAS
jgi:hypothetical protein